VTGPPSALDDQLPGTATAPVVVLGLVAAPGTPADVAGRLGGELVRALADRHPEVSWEVRPLVDGLVQPPAADDELVDAARRRSSPRTGTWPSVSPTSLRHGAGQPAVRQAAYSYRPDRAVPEAPPG
jgi:hypothetical protein